jgi:hypothetical protein
LPVLIIVFYGIVEISRLVQVHQKTNVTASTMSSLIARNFNINLATLNEYAGTLPAIMAPFKDKEGVGLIVSSLYYETGTGGPTTIWQFKYGPAGASKISAGIGAPPTLPNGLVLVEDDQVIAVETFFKYKPILNSKVIEETLGFSIGGVIYKAAIARPRFGSFLTPPT